MSHEQDDVSTCGPAYYYSMSGKAATADMHAGCRGGTAAERAPYRDRAAQAAQAAISSVPIQFA